MVDTLRQAFAEAYAHQVGFTGRCNADGVTNYVLHHYPDLCLQDNRRLVHKALRLEAKAFMKEQAPLSEEEVTSHNQLDLPLGILPGMRPPKTLIVEKAKGEFEHVRYDVATWADLEAALKEKTLNIDRAIARREDHLRKMDAMRPHLRDFPHRTVAEACELMRKEA